MKVEGFKQTNRTIWAPSQFCLKLRASLPEHAWILNHDGFCIMVMGSLSQLCFQDSTISCSDCTVVTV